MVAWGSHFLFAFVFSLRRRHTYSHNYTPRSKQCEAGKLIQFIGQISIGHIPNTQRHRSSGRRKQVQVLLHICQWIRTMSTARLSAKETSRMFRKVLLKRMESVNLQFRSHLMKKLGKATVGRGKSNSEGT